MISSIVFFFSFFVLCFQNCKSILKRNGESTWAARGQTPNKRNKNKREKKNKRPTKTKEQNQVYSVDEHYDVVGDSYQCQSK